jgi:hypothetical protein
MSAPTKLSVAWFSDGSCDRTGDVLAIAHSSNAVALQRRHSARMDFLVNDGVPDISDDRFFFI